MTDRISQLQEQGYSLSHASVMNTVEWAHSGTDVPNDPNAVNDSWCEACWRYVLASGHRDGYCPIPALGHAVMKELHWYETEASWHDPEPIVEMHR